MLLGLHLSRVLSSSAGHEHRTDLLTGTPAFIGVVDYSELTDKVIRLLQYVHWDQL